MAQSLKPGEFIGEIARGEAQYCSLLGSDTVARLAVSYGSEQEGVCSWPVKDDTIDLLIADNPNQVSFASFAKEAARVTRTTKLCAVVIAGPTALGDLLQMEQLLADEGLYGMRRAPVGMTETGSPSHVILVSRKVRPWRDVGTAALPAMGMGGKM